MTLQAPSWFAKPVPHALLPFGAVLIFLGVVYTCMGESKSSIVESTAPKNRRGFDCRSQGTISLGFFVFKFLAHDDYEKACHLVGKVGNEALTENGGCASLPRARPVEVPRP